MNLASLAALDSKGNPNQGERVMRMVQVHASTLAAALLMGSIGTTFAQATGGAAGGAALYRQLTDTAIGFICLPREARLADQVGLFFARRYAVSISGSDLENEF
jgi:hypothetical protein